jgi:hypothetical protein
MSAHENNARSPSIARRAWRGAAIAMLLTFVVAACGGSSAHHAGTSADPRKTITFPIKQENHEDIVAAVEACREGVALATWMPAASRAELDESCDKGLNRGLTEVRQYGEQVCGEVIFTLPASRAAEKTKIFAACEAKTEKFEPSMHSTLR